MAGSQAPRSLNVRPLTRHIEFAEAVELQRVIWKFDEIDLLPVRLFVVASHVGGQTLGAFDGRRMVGFLLAIPGVKAGGKPYLHSHMTGVLAEYQNSGAGRMLKLAQKEDALARGFRLIEWTFDPFNAKNAYFNLERLGAVVTGYIRNAYGTTTESSARRVAHRPLRRAMVDPADEKTQCAGRSGRIAGGAHSGVATRARAAV